MEWFDTIDDAFPTNHAMEEWCTNVITDEYIAIALSPPVQYSWRQKIYQVKLKKPKP